MEIRGVFGYKMLSIQVKTDELPVRPFPAWTVLCDIKEDGSFMWDTKEAKKLRATILKQLMAEAKLRRTK